MAVTVKGGQELKAKLKLMSASLSAEELQRAVFPAAELIRAEASKRAPRRTGALADHIITEIADKGPGKITFAIGPDKDRFYGVFVEFGTVKMSAQPFLFPAFESKKAEALQLLRQNLLSAVTRGG